MQSVSRSDTYTPGMQQWSLEWNGILIIPSLRDRNMANQEGFVVSVHFGTTYSSVSCHKGPLPPNDHSGVDDAETFQHSPARPKDLIQITGYPHARNSGKAQVAEVPTEMLCTNNRAQTKWGHSVHNAIAFPISDDVLRLQRFKLNLDDTEKTRRLRQDSGRILHKLGLTIEDAITQYLTFLLEHTKSQLTKHHDYTIGCPVQLVATVPAIWSASALTVMTRAVERAAQQTQFGDQRDVFLVSEPDAAATFFCECELNPGLEARNLNCHTNGRRLTFT